jgi:hypothetical protein
VTINGIGWLFDDPEGGGQNMDVEYPAKGTVTTHASIGEPPTLTHASGLSAATRSIRMEPSATRSVPTAAR